VFRFLALLSKKRIKGLQYEYGILQALILKKTADLIGWFFFAFAVN